MMLPTGYLISNLMVDYEKITSPKNVVFGSFRRHAPPRCPAG
jgi:hypothetical protein